ncbi:hypothetical protein INR75_02795 [Zunongwangia sp. SCSIO 43204]|uniref:hypothetical protein n=1 Tax=Zunongwangia sp. SCSIO 43204 TaxID=2779359 RepID=UPI001CA98BCC|nr:hypothetical protein [Zunongwangia sp. SCSIO 43204]UAB84975.1 hypothetical protein INR75_02795 [Zunongwangia sp. SCSIO 43204]
MHSPWGMLYQLVHETGWSWHTILWKVTRANLLLMMADRSNFKHTELDDSVQGSVEDLKRIKQNARKV